MLPFRWKAARDRRARAKAGERLVVAIELGSFDKGGLEKVVLDSALAFDRKAFEPIVVTPGAVGHLGALAREAGVRVEQLPAKDTLRAYRALLKDARVDLAMSHFSRLGYPLFRALRIPNITVIHNVYAFLNETMRKEFKADDRYVDRYIAVSDKAAVYASRNLGVDRAKIVTVPNGLILSEHRAREARPPALTRADLGVGAHDYVFVNPASYNLHKGHYVIAAALKEVLKARLDVKVVCVGNEVHRPHAQALRDHIAAQGLGGHMLLPGYFPHVEDVMRLADACLMPSFIEGWSIAMNEAMFYRLPLLMTDTGGAAEAIGDGETGILIAPEYESLERLDGRALDELAYAPRDYRIAQPLAQAMLRMAADPARWAAAGARGREKVVARYDFAHVVARYQDLMRETAMR